MPSESDFSEVANPWIAVVAWSYGSVTTIEKIQGSQSSALIAITRSSDLTPLKNKPTVMEVNLKKCLVYWRGGEFSEWNEFEARWLMAQAMVRGLNGEHVPRRGDAVDRWLRSWRDFYDMNTQTSRWRRIALNDVLDDYRSSAETTNRLNERCPQCPHTYPTSQP